MLTFSGNLLMNSQEGMLGLIAMSDETRRRIVLLDCDLLDPTGKLIFTTLWANSADDKLMLFLFFPENRIWHCMQIENRI